MNKENYFEKIIKDKNIITTTITGNSMFPMLRTNDKVLICNTNNYRLLDICLFKHNNKNVLHRLIRIKDDNYYFKGDNSINIEQVSKDDIVGVLVGYYKNNKLIEINNINNYLYYCISNINYPLLKMKRRILNSCV